MLKKAFILIEQIFSQVANGDATFIFLWTFKVKFKKYIKRRNKRTA